MQPSPTSDWVLQEELGRRANEDIEHVLEGCQDDKQITLLSVLHCWGRNSPSRVHGHLLAWLELASAQAGHQVGKLAAQLMTYQLLGPGLLDLWLELTTELASELSEANRAAALCNCSLLDDARLEPALLPHTHRLLEVLQACRTRTAAAALQRAPEAPLQGARSPPPSANLQVSGAGSYTASLPVDSMPRSHIFAALVAALVDGPCLQVW